MYSIFNFFIFGSVSIFKVNAVNTGVDNVTLTSSCQVIVDVQNVNDNPPHFLPPRVIVGNLAAHSKGTVIQISENHQKGTVFMHLRTEDPDGGENATIILEGCIPRPIVPPLTKAHSPQPVLKPVFEVDKRSGKCWTTVNLDRETEPAYVCTVIAVDSEISSGLTST